jgi:hypothetical protein
MYLQNGYINQKPKHEIAQPYTTTKKTTHQNGLMSPFQEYTGCDYIDVSMVDGA